MATSALYARYLDALSSTVDGEKRLAEELGQEDEYQRLVAKLIRENGGSDEVIKEYTAPNGCSGGRHACMHLLEHLCMDLTAVAQRVNMRLPPCLAVWWPDRAPTAASALGDGGGLIRVNVGLLVQLRMFMHLVCDSLAMITGEPKLWGEDHLTVAQARAEFLEMLDEYVGGQRVPLWKTVRVHGGQRERFRRLATIAGLAYVVAHELGHLDTQGHEYVQSALSGEGAPLQGRDFTEVQAVASFNMEGLADLAAIRILLEWKPIEAETWEFARVAGPGSVMAIQSTLFWMRAAMTDKQLDWMHPHPDLRIAGVCLGLGNPGELERIEQANAATKPIETENSKRAHRFVSWLDDVTGAAVFRQAALKRDLKSRGLTAIQLAALYIAHGVPKKEHTNDT